MVVGVPGLGRWWWVGEKRNVAVIGVRLGTFDSALVYRALDAVWFVTQQGGAVGAALHLGAWLLMVLGVEPVTASNALLFRFAVL